MATNTTTSTTVDLKFLRGTQANLNNLTNDKIVEGAFYLTTDTHRLYIGQSSSLVDLNKSITVVDKVTLDQGDDPAQVTALPAIKDADKNSYIGQFYYVKNYNILCIYTGNGWEQINPDTSLSDVTSAFVADADDDNIVIVTDTFTQSTVTDSTAASRNPTNTKRFYGENIQVVPGTRTVKQTVDGKEVDITVTDGIKLKGDTYSISLIETPSEDVETSTSASISFDKYTGKDDYAAAQETTTIEISGGTGIDTIVADGNTVTINATTNKEFLESVTNGTVILEVKDTATSKVGTSFTPKVTYGAKVSTPSTQAQEPEGDSTTNPVTQQRSQTAIIERQAKEGQNTAPDYVIDLDVYTIGDVDNLISGLEESIIKGIQKNDAMTYRGTIDVNDDENSLEYPSGDDAKIFVGDTWMISFQKKITVGETEQDRLYWTDPNTSITYKNGDMIIAMGTEGEDGSITEELTWDYIPSGNDTYKIKYASGKFTIAEGENSTRDIGSLEVKAADKGLITVTPNDVGNAGIPNVEYTISHAAVTTKKTTASTITQQAKKSQDITVVQGLTADGKGHITGYTAGKVTVVDTHNTIKSDATDLLSIDTTTNTLSSKLEMTDGDKATASVIFKSDSENLKVSSTKKSDTSDNSITFKLVWESFDS